MHIEFLTLLISIIAVVISYVSLVRTRATSEVQIELERISAELAKKQLARIEENEDREGQPIFIVRFTNVIAFTLGSEVVSEVTIFVHNTGESFLELAHVSLAFSEDGIWKQCPHAFLKQKAFGDKDRVLGEQKITLKPGCDLRNCTLQIRYVDTAGWDRIQEFEIFPEGGFPGDVGVTTPINFYFIFRKIYRIVPLEYGAG
ncbi:MAG: hypothetical protein KDJ24_08555 [Gammaproteobacteria bacterium]|nr:hypothetical protein [Gammaproteobacteria bacterium]